MKEIIVAILAILSLSLLPKIVFILILLEMKMFFIKLLNLAIILCGFMNLFLKIQLSLLYVFFLFYFQTSC